MRFHWGHGIALFITAFVIFMLMMVAKSFQTTFHLEADNYYEQEIAYQQRIDKIKNAGELSEPLACMLEGNSIVISYPSAHLEKGIQGSIHVFRPSDATKDQIVQINADSSGKQVLSTASFLKGYYKVKVEWEVTDGEKFYSEHPVFIN